jgi:selenocysteine-specific elongation factor
MAGEGDVVLLMSGRAVFSRSGWASLISKSRGFLAVYHETYPLRKGAPKEELRNRIGLTPQVFAEVFSLLQNDGIVVEEGPAARLTDHTRQLTDAQKTAAQAYTKKLASQPFAPPTEGAPDAEIVDLLVDEGQAVRVSETVVFAPSAYREMVDGITKHIEISGQITIGDVRDMFNTSRKYALALLEHLDQQRVTRRVGDGRVLR